MIIMSLYQEEHSFSFKVSQYIKLIKKAIKWGFFIEILLFLLLFFNFTFTDLAGEPMEPLITIKYFVSFLYPNHPNPASAIQWMEPDEHLLHYVGYADPALQEYIGERVHKIVYRDLADVATNGQYSQFVSLVKWSLVVSALVPIFYLTFFIYRGKSEEEEFLRGSDLMDTKLFNKTLKKIDVGSGGGGLRIGEVVIPKDLETKHTLILGTSGCGKGVLLNQLAAQINKRKIHSPAPSKIIFYDIKGEFVSKQFIENDVIFSAFDKRFCGWSFFNEFTTEPELDVLAKALFATENAKNEFFYKSAASIFKGGILSLASQNKIKNKDIWDFFTKTTEEIATEIKKLPSENQESLKFLTADETTASIMATLANRIEFFKYLRGLDGDFSFRNWVINGQQNIFMLNVEEYANIFKPLMTMIIDLLARSVLSLPDDNKRRIFFFLDELGTLDKMDSLLQLITVGRSKGAAIICAAQDLGRIEQAYGKANLKTIFNNFNTNFFFRLGEPETSRYVSSALGQRQIKRKTQSQSINAKESDNEGTNEQNATEDLIMPSELLNLADLTAYCRIANVGIAKIEVPKVFYKVIDEPFLKKEFASIFSIEQTAAASVEEFNSKPAAESLNQADKPVIKFKKM